MRRTSAALSVVALTLLSHLAVTPAGAAGVTSDDPDISTVVLEEEQTPGAVSDVTITFDNPTDSAEVEAELETLLQKPVSLEVEGDTAYAEGAPSQPLKKSRGFSNVGARDDVYYGDRVIHCGSSYDLVNSYGSFSIQRQCRTDYALWGYRLSSSMRDLCTSLVTESGMRWTNNGVNQPAGASHLVGDTYIFHGTFRGHSGVRTGDNVEYYDYFACRHSISGGGDVLLKIFGTLRFRAAA